MEKSNRASVNQSIAMNEWSSVWFPVQWFVVAEMTCPFEKDENGVWFKKYFPHFVQMFEFSKQCGNPHRKLQAIIFNWFRLKRDNYF